jgi:rhodanese-related sulfurtransferase
MKQKLSALLLPLLALFHAACGQNPASPNRIGHCRNAKFDKEVAAWLSFSVPAIDVDSLRKINADSVIILDAREPAEFAVSHIPGAMHCGYDRFDSHLLDSLDKSRPVVVYCSIGYRSEKIARKLQKAGFTNVSNLYGSIFEWVNRGYPVVDTAGQITPRLHTYNRSWGRWVSNPACMKTN